MRSILLFVSISVAMQAQYNPPLTAKQIIEADSPMLRGQALLEGYPDFPSVSSLTTIERARAIHEAVSREVVALAPRAETSSLAGVTSVTALKHKIPRQARKANERGIAFAKRNEHVKATAEFARAITLDPQFADAHNNRGSEALFVGNLAEAAREFRSAVELNPALAPSYISLAITELLMGDRKEAREHVRRGITLGDGSADARSVLIYTLLGD